MIYSATAESALFVDAQLHDNEKSEQALIKEIKASHHLLRNNPVVRIGATRFRASCIGAGAKPVFSPELFPDDFITAFEEWKQYCNFSGVSNFSGVQALAVMTAIIEGRAFIVRRRTLDFIPLQLEVVSPLCLAINLEEQGKSSYVRGGILYAKNGKPKKYAFYKLPRDHPDFNEDSVNWIPVEDVVDIRDVFHPNQSGAQPWITAGADFAKQYKDNQTVEIKSRMKRQGQQVFALREQEVNQSHNPSNTPAIGNKDTKLVHKVGGITVLNGVKEIKTASPAEIAGNYKEHNSQVLRMLAGLFGIPYEMLTGDLNQVNYSSIRAGMINHRRFIGQLRSIDLEPAFNKVIRWFCDAYHLTSNPKLPGYFDNPYKYIAPTWVWPEWEEIDPLKAAKALVLELQKDITSLEKIANQRGSTLDQHLDSVERSHAAYEKRGIRSNETSTPVNDKPDDDDDA